MVIHPYANILYAYVKNIKFKGQFHTEFMNVRDTSYNGDSLTCKTKYDYVKGQKSWGVITKPCHKPYKFDLIVKGQCCIMI